GVAAARQRGSNRAARAVRGARTRVARRRYVGRAARLRGRGPRLATSRDGCRRALAHRRVPETLARVSDSAYQGPKRGNDGAVLLAHGAGADMSSPTLTSVSDALADAKIPSLRFQFPYRAAGRRAPDRPPVLVAAVRDAAAELARLAKVPPDRLVLGGRSMG